MAIARTNTNLASFCIQVVGAPYWYGTFGQKGNAQLYAAKKKQYPAYYPPKSWTEESFKKQYGKRVTDCAGLIKWFLWSNNMTDKSPTYKASEDWGANTFYSKCTEKGKIGSLPSEKVGILVFKGTDSKKNHVGVIVDNSGTVVEAKGHAYGTIKSKAKDWGYWGKCNLIKYESTPTPPEPPKPTNQYTVHTNSGDALRLRAEPNTTSKQTGWIDNGTTFTSDKVVEGQNVGGVKTWVYYKCGYASGKYLTPTPVLPAAEKPVEKPTEPSEPIVEPAPIPEPAKPATPSGKTYRVIAVHGLNVRSGAGKNYPKCAPALNYGAKVTVYEVKNGWGRIGTGKWCCMDYLK